MDFYELEEDPQTDLLFGYGLWPVSRAAKEEMRQGFQSLHVSLQVWQGSAPLSPGIPMFQSKREAPKKSPKRATGRESVCVGYRRAENPSVLNPTLDRQPLPSGGFHPRQAAGKRGA